MRPARPIVGPATVLNLEAKVRGIGLYIGCWTRVAWEPEDSKGTQRAWLEVDTGRWERLVSINYKPGHRGFPYAVTRSRIEVYGHDSKVEKQALRALQVRALQAWKALGSKPQ